MGRLFRTPLSFFVTQRLFTTHLVFGVAVAVLGFACVAHAAEPTAAQKKQIAAVGALVLEGGKQFQAGNFEACGEKIRAAQDLLVEFVREGGPESLEIAQPIHSKIKRAAAMLELEGIRVKPVDLAAEADVADMKKTPEPGKPEPNKPDPKSPKPTPTPTPTTGVSFTREVAPILVTHCGRCHVNGNRGNFTMTSYAVLMKGPPEGVVIFPGDLIGSRLIETIQTGDMPRGGKVPPEQFETLKKWVTEGAKFDGPDPAALLTSFVRNAPAGNNPNPPPALEAAMSTGKETVSFARQIAPILLENCNGCHIDAMQTRGGLRMDALAQLLRGGDSGAVIERGKAADSLIVKKLRGESGDRMPAGGRPPLSEEQIQLISTWINEGATLDDGTPEQPLRVLAAKAWAKAATPEQLSERRWTLAQKHWALGSPGAKLTRQTTDHFEVIGDQSPATLELVGKLAESQVKPITTLTKAAGKEEPFRGRVTIFVFPKRYAYSEFGKMIESRGLPNDWTGHWAYDGVDAYVAIVVSPSEEEESIKHRLGGLLTSQALAQLGDVPRWISEGIGRMTVARDAGKTGPAANWDAAVISALSSIDKPDEFLQGKLPPEQADLIAYGMAKFLFDRSNRRGTERMLRALHEGKALKDAVAYGFNATPQQLVTTYAAWQRSTSMKKR